MKKILISILFFSACSINSGSPPTAQEIHEQHGTNCPDIVSTDNAGTQIVPMFDSNAQNVYDMFSYSTDDATTQKADIHDISAEILEEVEYPPGPYSLELFNVVPNMKFYDPWNNIWIHLSDYFKHSENKVLILVSSAGWCMPCVKEAVQLIDVYEEYHKDGLEIIYTLGHTNIPGDVPFDTTIDDPTSEGYYIDLEFMNSWKIMIEEYAGKELNYEMYADTNMEFYKYEPTHAWPFSLLITTKDMGIRLVEEGYWPALMENKLIMTLYSEVPDIPFK